MRVITERDIPMGSKGFLNTFIIVLAATLIFFGFSSVGALVFNDSSSNNFGDQTFVGPLDVSNKKNKQ